MRPHISFSELQAFACECQHKWKLDYLQEHRSEEFSINFDFGTACHGALEKYLTRKDPLDTDAAVQLFREKLTKLLESNESRYPEPISAADKADLFEGGERIIRLVRDTPELQDIEVIHNEFKLFEPIHREDGIDIKFKGYIDIVIKGKDKRGNTLLWVCDFKTCSWGWGRDKRDDRWKHYQLFLYKHFLCKKFDIDPKQVRVAFILLKKKPSKGAHPVEFFPVSAGPVSVQRALNVLNENITEISEREKDESYKKDRKFCINQYGRKCPYLSTPLCPDDPR